MAKSPTLKTQLANALAEQMSLQKQLIKVQQENIELRKKVESLQASVPDDDVHWNKVSGGLTSDEVLANGDLTQIMKLNEWVFSFGEKYIKPYVHHIAYAEMIGHMTRGIAKKMAIEEVNAEFGDTLPEGKTLQFVDIQRDAEKSEKKTTNKSKSTTPKQKKLLDDD